MADQSVELQVSSGGAVTRVSRKLVDLGDGYHAPQVILAGGANGSQVQGTVASGIADAGNPVKVGGKYNATPPTLTDANRGDMQLDANGNVRVKLTGGSAAATDATTNSIAYMSGASDNANRLLGTAAFRFNGSTWDRATTANATHRLLSAAATTNATSVKASAGRVRRIWGGNTVASKRYLKLYNKASAPTVGTDTPILTFVIQASAPFDIAFTEDGHYFSTGIAYALTTAAADADTGALSAGDIECMNISYS